MLSRNGRSKSIAGAVVLALVAVLFTPTSATAAVTGTTTRVSVAGDGTPGNLNSHGPDISGDGRYVVFSSHASNLVADDTNERPDVFVHDRQAGATTRISVASDGTQSTPPTNSSSLQAPQISADGRYVTFASSAPDLVAGDTNARPDIFVHDRNTGATTRVNVGAGGTQSNANSGAPDISADGRYVAFDSGASNLGEGPDLNPLQDVFIHDRQSGTTALVSVTSSGDPALGINNRASISANGRYVAFDSNADNLTVGNTNRGTNVFVRDRQAATTTLVSSAPDGSPAGGTAPSISANGGSVAFQSSASNLVTGDTNAGPDVFVRDLGPRVTSRVSPNDFNNFGSLFPDISADGRYVSFSHQYVHDRTKGRTERVNVATDGTPADGGSSSDERTAVSDDGRYVVFDAAARNLVEGDTNGASDIFVRDRRSVPPVPAVSVGNATVHEGDAGTRGAVFTVSLSSPSTSTVTVGYATTDASFVPATPGDDYASRSGTLSFAPGVTSQTVKIAVVGDTADEGIQEHFDLRLSDVSGAFVADGAGIGTIFDDDPDTRPGLRLAIGDVMVHEGDSGTRVAVFNVSLSQPHSSTATVAYETVKGTATKAADFTGKSGTLNFAPGVTSQQVKVQVGADALAEGNETFTVALTTVSGGFAFVADGNGIGTIIDND